MQQLPISVAAVIVAAGRGSRMAGADGPKQYRTIGGKTVLAHTLSAFLDHPAIERIVCVIHPADTDLYAEAAGEHEKLLAPVAGGETRQASVRAGLEALGDNAPQAVLIHDAARPFVSGVVIDGVINGLARCEGALPTLAIADTLKRANDDGLVRETVDRSGLYAAQTPQGFAFHPILEAHRAAVAAGRSDFTDDSALAEWAGIDIALVAGDPANTKLTTQADMDQANRLLSPSLPDIRVGHGYDTHQLVDGDKLYLCGIEIPFEKRLSGHSDADVGLHALTDAILATIADGDIGSHFPPSDEKWKGASSDQFLAHACALVRRAGGTITHVDVTLLCERPKIGPHRDAMRAAIARIADLEIGRVSVKATTNERIGFIGREEGIVALATATVVMTGRPL